MLNNSNLNIYTEYKKLGFKLSKTMNSIKSNKKFIIKNPLDKLRGSANTEDNQNNITSINNNNKNLNILAKKEIFKSEYKSISEKDIKNSFNFTFKNYEN